MPSAAQIAPDPSLNSRVDSLDRLNFTIEDGTRSGANLFHSFSQFSIPTGGSARFNHAPEIQTIFARITGSIASAIDGQLTAKANLYLLNPNGIFFGPNAQLNLGGSLLATTADRIQFADGISFAATDQTPLLSISTPIGLQMGQTPGSISQQGYGHGLATYNPILQPYGPIAAVPSLAVQPGKAIVLVGGDIKLMGGVLQAPEGRIDLASLGSGASIALDNYQLGPIAGPQNNIHLGQKSLLDVNGIASGNTQLQGKNILLDGGALVWNQNRGQRTGGSIVVRALESLRLDGTAPDFASVSGFINETVGPGNAGNIQITAPNILVKDGANIMSRSFFPVQGGRTGDILIRGDRLQISGYSPVIPDIFSVIATYTGGGGVGGDLKVTVADISILNGGSLSASTSGTSNGGNIQVDAKQVAISGLTSKSVGSSISSVSFGNTGDSGTLVMNTERLTISNGGLLVASSIGDGNAGKITINASDSIQIIGNSQLDSSIYQALIASAVDYPREPYKSLFNLPDTLPKGSSGDITINTPRLAVTNDAYITVTNFSSGISGSLSINAEKINLTDGGFISAGSVSGQGGNLLLNASESVTLNRQGSIFTSSQGSGNGGNIKINTPILLGVNDSDIIANSVTGTGGQIRINSKGVLGLKFRDRLTLDNDITASSEFGLSGNVEIMNLGFDPNSGLTALPVNTVDPNRKISSSCQATQGSKFVVTGRGGTAIDPSRTMVTQTLWQDWQGDPAINPQKIAQTPPSQPIQLSEANTWDKDLQGNIQLIAKTADLMNPTPTTCAKSSRQH